MQYVFNMVGCFVEIESPQCYLYSERSWREKSNEMREIKRKERISGTTDKNKRTYEYELGKGKQPYGSWDFYTQYSFLPFSIILSSIYFRLYSVGGECSSCSNWVQSTNCHWPHALTQMDGHTNIRAQFLTCLALYVCVTHHCRFLSLFFIVCCIYLCLWLTLCRWTISDSS